MQRCSQCQTCSLLWILQEKGWQGIKKCWLADPKTTPQGTVRTKVGSADTEDPQGSSDSCQELIAGVLGCLVPQMNVFQGVRGKRCATQNCLIAGWLPEGITVIIVIIIIIVIWRKAMFYTKHSQHVSPWQLHGRKSTDSTSKSTVSQPMIQMEMPGLVCGLCTLHPPSFSIASLSPVHRNVEQNLPLRNRVWAGQRQGDAAQERDVGLIKQKADAEQQHSATWQEQQLPDI